MRRIRLHVLKSTPQPSAIQKRSTSGNGKPWAKSLNRGSQTPSPANVSCGCASLPDCPIIAGATPDRSQPNNFGNQFQMHSGRLSEAPGIISRLPQVNGPIDPGTAERSPRQCHRPNCNKRERVVSAFNGPFPTGEAPLAFRLDKPLNLPKDRHANRRFGIWQ